MPAFKVCPVPRDIGNHRIDAVDVRPGHAGRVRRRYLTSPERSLKNLKRHLMDLAQAVQNGCQPSAASSSVRRLCRLTPNSRTGRIQSSRPR
jgi:hypothetical protein